MSKKRLEHDKVCQFKKKYKPDRNSCQHDTLSEPVIKENATKFGILCSQFYLTLLQKQMSFVMMPHASMREKQNHENTEPITIDISEDDSSETEKDQDQNKDLYIQNQSAPKFSKELDDEFSDLEPPPIPLRAEMRASPAQKIQLSKTNQVSTKEIPAVLASDSKSKILSMKIIFCGLCQQQKFGTQLYCCKENICKFCIAKIPLTCQNETNQVHKEPHSKMIRCPFCSSFFPNSWIPSSFLTKR